MITLHWFLIAPFDAADDDGGGEYVASNRPDYIFLLLLLCVTIRFSHIAYGLQYQKIIISQNARGHHWIRCQLTRIAAAQMDVSRSDPLTDRCCAGRDAPFVLLLLLTAASYRNCDQYIIDMCGAVVWLTHFRDPLG